MRIYQIQDSKKIKFNGKDEYVIDWLYSSDSEQVISMPECLSVFIDSAIFGKTFGANAHAWYLTMTSGNKNLRSFYYAPSAFEKIESDANANLLVLTRFVCILKDTDQLIEVSVNTDELSIVCNYDFAKKNQWIGY